MGDCAVSYHYKGFVFSKIGRAVIPTDLRPTAACWEAYHGWLLLPKKEQEACRV